MALSLEQWHVKPKVIGSSPALLHFSLFNPQIISNLLTQFLVGAIYQKLTLSIVCFCVAVGLPSPKGFSCQQVDVVIGL